MRSILFILSLLFAVNCKSQTFNYYYGNIHSQTSYSDGNKDSATSLITKPLQAYNYAKLSSQIDFYGISDHNHLSAGMTSPAHFHSGIADANTANSDGSFVALYGQEWGVISGGGHVIVYGYDSLMGWDPSDYDVYVAQSNYSGLWSKINAKAGAFGYLAHPQTTDYTNLFTSTVNASADNAIIGMAARSGPAFSINSSYSNPSTSDFVPRYQEALSRGYHLGIGLDHDTHNSVFGRQTAGRLVVLSPSLTRNNILDAFRKMRFYSSDDWNVKVDFNINSQPMGSIYTHSTSPTISVNIVDPDAESIASITVYYGVPGSNVLPTVLTSNASSNSLSYTHTITTGSTYYYYLEIKQTDGDVIWTSPIWYTRNSAYTANAPTTNFSIAAGNNCVGQAISLTDLSTNTPTTWSWTMLGATTPSSIIKNPTVTYTAAGIYTVTLISSNATGTGLPLTQTISVGNSPTVIATSASVCSGSSITINASGATSYSWSTGATAASINVSPTITTQYTVTGNSGGCAKTTTTSITVSPGPSITATSNPNAICAGQTAILIASGATTYSWSTGPTTASTSVSPISTTQYSVTGTSLGCSKTTTISITVSPIPTVTAVSSSSTICSGQTATLTASGATTYSWSTGPTTTSISVSPMSTTLYSVTGTAGCSKTTTISITVSPIPTVTAVSSSSAICSGQIATLTASGAVTYSWNTGATSVNINVNPIATTQYSVVGTSGLCSKTTSIVLNVNPNPSINIASSSSVICAGQTATLIANGATTYSWSTGALTSNINVTPTVTTIYSVTGTNSFGCTNTSTITQIESTCTLLSELEKQADFNVYPNPFYNSIMIINFYSSFTDGNVTITNITGALIYSGKLENNKIEINLEYLPQGMYFIRLQKENLFITKKLIKE